MLHLRRNKDVILLLLLVIPMMSMLPWKKKKLQQYFPLTNGSWWEYWQYSPKDNELFMMPRITITGDTMLNGKLYRMRAGAGKDSAIWAAYYRYDGAKLYQYRLSYQEEFLQVDFSARKGTKREINRDTLNYKLMVLSTDTSFKALDTTFTHVYCEGWFDKTNRPLYRMYYKRDVGMVGADFLDDGSMMYLKSWFVNQRRR